MADRILTGVDDGVLRRLHERARANGRTPAEEARAILVGALRGNHADPFSSSVIPTCSPVAFILAPKGHVPMVWKRFHRLVDETVARLRSADGDREKIESAIRRYVERGDKLGMSPLDLWDFFAISSPGIPKRAGYCGVDCEQMEAIFERMSKEKFGGD